MFLVMMFLFAIGVAGSQETGSSPPDVKDFRQVLSKELEFRIDDYKTAFVGRIIVYQNPTNPNEFIRVYYRHIALNSGRAKEQRASDTGGSNTNLSDLNYHRKQEVEALGRVEQSTDAFAYVQEQTVRDSRTGQDIRTGSRQIWLLDPSGVWAYYVQPANEKSALESSPFSEPSKANPKKRINVGIKFDLADRSHIVRIDQDDILALIKGNDDEKK